MAKNSAAAKRRGSSTSRKKATKDLHIVPQTQGWAIRSEGSARVMSLHLTRRQAVEVGRALAKKDAITLVIHYRDGRVKERISFNRDPMPPRQPPTVLYPLTPPLTASRDAIKKAVLNAIREAANMGQKKEKTNVAMSNKNDTQRKSKAGSKRYTT